MAFVDFTAMFNQTFLDEFDIPKEDYTDLYNYLDEFVSEHKRELFDEVLKERTRKVTVVLEDIFQPQNASAVLRTCEAMGVQDIHIIEEEYEYKLNPQVTIGCAKWLTLHKYANTSNNTITAFDALKKKGYQIIGTTPHEKDCTIDELDLSQPIAFVFGNEKRGLSQTAIDNCDGYVKIPMYGFSESFNISVSAAIIFSNVISRIRKSDKNWKLTDKEIFKLKLIWSYQSIKRADRFVRYFKKNKDSLVLRNSSE